RLFLSILLPGLPVGVVDCDAYDSLADAILGIDANERNLAIFSNQHVEEDVTVPANVNLIFSLCGCLNIDAGDTVTINGTLEAGLYQIFEGDGDVVFGLGSVEQVEISWFGVTGDDAVDDHVAMQKAITAAGSGTTHISIAPTRWKITDYLEIIDDNATIKCEWKEGTIRQGTWGYPVFYIRADNVSIYNPYLVSTETRSAISDDMATAHSGDGAENEGTLDAFNFSAGIFISAERDDKGSRFQTNRWYAEGFTVGIFARGSVGQDL
ncbi:unnamed protein product, partial [marine sediment metagenome]